MYHAEIWRKTHFFFGRRPHRSIYLRGVFFPLLPKIHHNTVRVNPQPPFPGTPSKLRTITKTMNNHIKFWTGFFSFNFRYIFRVFRWLFIVFPVLIVPVGDKWGGQQSLISTYWPPGSPTLSNTKIPPNDREYFPLSEKIAILFYWHNWQLSKHDMSEVKW